MPRGGPFRILVNFLAKAFSLEGGKRKWWMVKVVNGCIGGAGDAGWWCWYMHSDLFVHILPCLSSYQCAWRRLHMHVCVPAYMHATACKRMDASACQRVHVSGRAPARASACVPAHVMSCVREPVCASACQRVPMRACVRACVPARVGLLACVPMRASSCLSVPCSNGFH